MFTKKVIRIKTEQMNELKEMEKEILANNGEVTTTRLIREAIGIFLKYYKKEVIEKYSANYTPKMEEKHD